MTSRVLPVGIDPVAGVDARRTPAAAPERRRRRGRRASRPARGRRARRAPASVRASTGRRPPRPAPRGRATSAWSARRLERGDVRAAQLHLDLLLVVEAARLDRRRDAADFDDALSQRRARSSPGSGPGRPSESGRRRSCLRRPRRSCRRPSRRCVRRRESTGRRAATSVELPARVVQVGPRRRLDRNRELGVVRHGEELAAEIAERRHRQRDDERCRAPAPTIASRCRSAQLITRL